jgi:hypothetical protein
MLTPWVKVWEGHMGETGFPTLQPGNSSLQNLLKDTGLDFLEKSV